ncbi:MAG: hypothetical protein A2V50_08470 [Bacteroidetes bacterium RBG_19FT_COMBO_42_10]|nr:MAG: hypothetical protein A2V50_08470 [Bacteroidetes bacterium RBG_19FT_COMBO_42_10]
MKTKAYKKLLVIFIALGSWIAGNSQQFPDSLLQYLEISAKNNPTIQQRFTEYQAALQKVPQVGSLSDPELSLGVFLKPMELVNGNQAADIRLMQMFPWFGVLKHARDEMSLMANAKFELFRDAKLQVFYDVQRTWYDLYKVRAEISISENNLVILKSIEELAIVKFKAAPSTDGGTSSSGSSGLADLYGFQIEIGELENSIELLKNQERTLLAQFNSYLDKHPLSPVFTGEDLAADSSGISLIAVSDSMLAKNPMLSMLELEKQSYSAQEKKVAGMSYPMVGLGLDYSLISKSGMSASAMNGKDMIMPMVTVTLPVYRKKYKAMQAEAELLGASADQKYKATVNSLQTEYYHAVQLYQDAQRRVKLYEKQYNLASRSLDLILKSFSASSVELTEVLRVQQQTLDYELKQVEAVADFNTAVAWLKRLMAFSQVQ